MREEEGGREGRGVKERCEGGRGGVREEGGREGRGVRKEVGA